MKKFILIAIAGVILAVFVACAWWMAKDWNKNQAHNVQSLERLYGTASIVGYHLEPERNNPRLLVVHDVKVEPGPSEIKVSFVLESIAGHADYPTLVLLLQDAAGNVSKTTFPANAYAHGASLVRESISLVLPRHGTESNVSIYMEYPTK